MDGGPFLLTPEEQEAWVREQRGQLLDPPQAGLMPDPNPPLPGGGALQRPPAGGAPRRGRPSPSFFGGSMFSDNGLNLARGGFNLAQIGAGQQGAHLGGMIGQVQQAISDENDSRVAQERERRRQEHEKELLRLQQEYALQRLQAEREIMRQQRIAADRANGVLWSSTWNR